MLFLAIIAALSASTSPAPSGSDELAAGRDFQSQRTQAEATAKTTGSTVGSQEIAGRESGYANARSRSQVLAELEQAKADGSYDLLHRQLHGQ